VQVETPWSSEERNLGQGGGQSGADKQSSLYDQLMRNRLTREEESNMTQVFKEAKEEDTVFFSQIEQIRQSKLAQECEEKKKTAELFKEEKARIERERQQKRISQADLLTSFSSSAASGSHLLRGGDNLVLQVKRTKKKKPNEEDKSTG